VRKYWHSCSWGIVGGHAIDAKFGRMLWKRWRKIESGLVSMENSSLMVISNFVGGRCGWVIIPLMALRDVVWMFNARATKAWDCGSYIPRPPFFKSSCDIRRECSGRLSKFNSLERKLEIMSLIADVRGPLYRVKGVDMSRVTVLRLWSVSVRSRWGIFWTVHDWNNRSRV
jgi:hypothetical protein